MQNFNPHLASLPSSPSPGSSARTGARCRGSRRRIGLAVTFATALAPAQGAAASAPPSAIINDAVDAIAAATRAGTSFVFGYLGGGTLPFDLKMPGAEFILALQALPVVLVMSVLTTLLFYWRILPPIVRGFSWAARAHARRRRRGRAVDRRQYLPRHGGGAAVHPAVSRQAVARSELFIVMTGGMAGIAGTVLVLYATILGPVIPDAAGHLVIASVLGAPAAILISLI